MKCNSKDVFPINRWSSYTILRYFNTHGTNSNYKHWNSDVSSAHLTYNINASINYNYCPALYFNECAIKPTRESEKYVIPNIYPLKLF